MLFPSPYFSQGISTSTSLPHLFLYASFDVKDKQYGSLGLFCFHFDLINKKDI
jgi:hypothetical protein